MEFSNLETRWMRGVPDTAPLTHYAQERMLKCDGCGECKPESTLGVREFVGGMQVRICKGKKCWSGWKTANKK